MGCLNTSFQQQCTALADKTLGNQSQVQIHNPEKIQADDRDWELQQLINTRRETINSSTETTEERCLPQGITQLALRMYHILENIRVMLVEYFSWSPKRFSISDYATEWIKLEVGIAMGCTISPIQFVIAMEVILKVTDDSACPANRGCG
ncbi:reverse transcriptase [Elysia marginata]|uniref:Reverse transcriptase n=1 Tax=Elysia marginata TaxID=1093978 RepID=A0AAV4EKN0_9GAST|nr:reverse transcriptase [Elysia marginata]